MSREVQPIWKEPRKHETRRKPIAPKSPRAAAWEDEKRHRVRAVRLALSPRCEGPGRGLPGECASPDPSRPELEVHEIVPRSRAKGSHLVLELTATLCQRHHDDCTSPTGEAKQRAEAALLLLPSEAVVFVDDEVLGRRLPFLTDDWYRKVRIARNEARP